MRIPLPLSADFYTIGSPLFASKEAKEYSLYNLVNRYAPRDTIGSTDNRMVMFGINDFVQRHLSQPVTLDDIEETDKFLSRSHSFGGKFNWDKDLWLRVVNEFNGYLPVSIKSISDGGIFWPNEPYLEVESTVDGFGELCVHLEARLLGMVSNGTACATVNRHWLDRLVEYVKKDTNEDPYIRARRLVHNFGARASSVEEESVLFGRAHLLSFNGTDNADAAYSAFKDGCKVSSGSSILALAHHSIMNYTTEQEAFSALEGVIKDTDKIASFVIDTYDHHNAIARLVEMAKNRPDVTYVCRPDSGSYKNVVLDVCNAAKQAGLYTIKNGKMYPKNLQCIYGDSVNPDKSFEILDILNAKGYAATFFVCFGVGGYLRNTPTRDLFSSAYKLAEYGKDRYKVVKLSETKSKMSVPGKTILHVPSIDSIPTVYESISPESRNFDRKETQYFHNGKGIPYIRKFNFSETQNRAIKDFDFYSHIDKDYGGLINPLSASVKDIQNRFHQKYKGRKPPRNDTYFTPDYVGVSSFNR